MCGRCVVSRVHSPLACNTCVCRLFYTVVDQVFVPNAQKVLGRISRKTVVVGFARMMGEVPDFLSAPRKATWCVVAKL